MRALVIEDDPDLREQVTKFLSDDGFAVDVAADGDNGVYMAEEYPADIAIIDLGLPGLHGLDILRQVRQSGRKYDGQSVGEGKGGSVRDILGCGGVNKKK